MKKILVFLVCTALLFSAVSCSSNGVDDSSDDKSLSSLINSGSSVVDLEGQTFTEDVSISKAVTVKNADFGGKTITINKTGVTLQNIQNAKIIVSEGVGEGDFSINSSSDIYTMSVLGGGQNSIRGQNSIHITNTNITVLIVGKENVRIELNNSTVVSTLELTVKATKIDSSSSNSSSKPKIKNFEVSKETENIDVGGVEITDIKVETSASTTKTPVITVTSGDAEIKNVSVVEKNDDGSTTTVSEKPVRVVITQEAEDNGFTAPAGTKEIKIDSISLVEGNNVKKIYEEGDSFDFTGLSAKIEYDDGSNTSVILSKSNTEISGFGRTVGSYKVSFYYNGTNVNGCISITVKETTSEYKTLINEGISLLSEKDYDGAVAKFKTAYEKEKNDTTKMYYALTQLALISVDSSVNTIITKNLGITNYPSELNALINGKWLKEYANTDKVCAYTFEKSTSSSYGYVRCNLTKSYYGTGTYLNWVSYKLLPEYNRWVYTDEVESFDSGYYTVTPSNSGNYMVDSGVLSGSDYSEYLYSVNWNDYKYIRVGTGEYTKIPSFNIPTWFKDTDAYEESLLGTTQTTTTASMLIFANLVDLNTNGFNDLIDNVVKVFGEKFETAKSLAAEMSESSVALPYQLIDALNLTDVLGDDETITIGKAELNVLIASVELLKGTFEWLSSYNFSLDLSSLKRKWKSMDAEEQHSLLFTIPTKDSLTSRNDSAMSKAKNTYVEAANLLTASYEYITSSASSYPQAAKEAIIENGDIIYQSVKVLGDAVKNGKTAYFNSCAENSYFSTNVTDEAEAEFSINFGKFFTPGALSNIFERDSSGRIKPYFYYEGNASNTDGISNFIALPETYAELKKIIEQVEKEFVDSSTNSYNLSIIYIIGYKLNTNVLNSVITSSSLQKLTGSETLLPIWKEGCGWANITTSDL